MTQSTSSRLRKHASPAAFITALLFAAVFAVAAAAHPLGNFTVNHFTLIRVGGERVRLRYVVDMAEIPAVQELQTADADGDGSTSASELDAYLVRVAQEYSQKLWLEGVGGRVPLRVAAKGISTPAGAGGLPILRAELELEGALPAPPLPGGAQTLRFEDANHRERLGWHEIVISPDAGIAVFDSSAYGSGVTDELKNYPRDMLSAPLDERKAEFSFARGAGPAGAAPLLNRDGRPAPPPARDYFAELIAVPQLTLGFALLALVAAAGLGGLHALSPGHGKTVVGAYLVGTRGTARHAVFLGLTVTITHTVGVFALGLVTLFASQYVLPERLFPLLSLVSGLIVVAIGVSLFVRRLRAALGGAAPGHVHTHGHEHTHAQEHQFPHDHSHEHGPEHTHDAGPGLTHTHGGRTHTHLPPGADGGAVTWRSLLALGISGGLLPCPSALVVLLSAISLHRVGFGLLLIVAFSLGLASVLTGVGLAFVYGGRLMKGRVAVPARVRQVVPAASAFVIACVGAAICYEALVQSGVNFGALLADPRDPLSTTSVLAFGLVLGLKHAVEADHLAAVSTIVSERKSVLSASLVGGLWGVGHTFSLLLAGAAVILLRVRIDRRMELALEFCVALMLVLLGADAIRKLFRGGHLHLHAHQHGGRRHIHPHLHDGQTAEAEGGTHHGLRLSKRPLVVGMVHGLAGSAALMLLVLSTIPSPLTGLAYIAVFGAGSIGGMMLMSALVGLPVHFTANRFARANLAVRCVAGLFSICFGLFMAYEIGFVDGLFR